MEAQMDVIDNGNCADQWRAVSGASIFDTHICIEAEGRSACNVSFLQSSAIFYYDETFPFVQECSKILMLLWLLLDNMSSHA